MSFIVFILHSTVTGTSVFADAKFYFSYTRSLVFDHDLLLGNEFFNFGLLKKTPTDLFIPSFYPPGTSMFWLPLFYMSYELSNLIKIVLHGTHFTGYEILFEYSCGLTNILLGIFGLYLVYRLLLTQFNKTSSLMTVSALFLTTNLFFYIAVEPINSHAVSFFTSSLFIYYFFIYQKEKYYYLILGALGGVAGIVRTQDLVLLTLPAIQILSCSFLSPLRLRLRLFITYCFLFITGVFIGFLPQILLWKYFYNTFWYSPYFEVGFNFTNPQIFHVLFNPQNGLFTRTPIIGIGVLGLLFPILSLFNKFKFRIYNLFRISNFVFRISLYAFFYFLLQLYLIASWNVYTQGGSYSIRMMVTTYPLLAFGLAGVIEKVTQKIGDRSIVYIVGFFTVFNFLSIFIYLFKY